MIYFLFSISFIAYLSLKMAQAYYEHFNIAISPKKHIDNEPPAKNAFSWRPKILIWIFLKIRKPNWTIKGDKSIERKLSIIKSLSQFIAVFCIVSFIFSLLQLWLDTTTNINATQATILKIEETQFKIKNVADHFKIGFGYDLIIIILLITFAGSFPLLEKYKVKEKLGRYSKLIKYVLLFLTISTSFTFFGNRFASKEEGRIGELEIHKLQILDSNKLLLKRINEAVTDKVVNEILSNPEVEALLDIVEDTKKSIKETKENDDYKNIASIAPGFIKSLAITKYEKNYKEKYNFTDQFEKLERKFQKEYSKNSHQTSDYYKSKRESDYSNFKEKNKQWYDESKFTQSSVKQTQETFEGAYEASKTKYSKYYSKYKEPIEKLIKKGYNEIGGEWIKSFFEVLGVDFPFLDKFIDPLINEPIEDYITKKTESIFKNCTKNQTEIAEKELTNCGVEFKEMFNNKISRNDKFLKLKREALTDGGLLKSASSSSISQIRSHVKKANDHLSLISSQSRWEIIRQDFLDRVNNEAHTLEGFSSQQKKAFKEVLDDWNSYKQSNKLNWQLNSVNDIEEEFFKYSKDNGYIKATWGFILQQQDWNGAIDYYTITHPDKTATGKPYYLLKYYYDSTGKLEQFESLYDGKTVDGVVSMCPH